ncbi:MAG: type II toxin-antitoxin system RelE/ParE family toxin [Planctomycetota bacterium]
MNPLLISHAADQDLIEVWRYVGVQEGDTNVAHRILVEIRDQLLALCRFPNLGVSCPEFEGYVTGVRAIQAGDYVIYYRNATNEVQIGRMVHYRRERTKVIENWRNSDRP